MKFFWTKEDQRAGEGGGVERCHVLEGRVEKLEARLDQLHEKIATLTDLPVQWATTTTQLRRLVGHVTKTAALDRNPPEPPPPAPPHELTQDDVIAQLNRAPARAS